MELMDWVYYTLEYCPKHKDTRDMQERKFPKEYEELKDTLLKTKRLPVKDCED